MKTYEMRIKDAVEADENVKFIATPKYGNNPFPDEIHLRAEGDNGINLDVVIKKC